ncbi:MULTISPECIES: ferredoxin [Protofrankia]|uniref:Ferredoxin n=1 Tax=Candidatus Protofrankia datiscae TaxID=2716812 RepID=F8AWN0_9ACTN|nr:MULTISPECIES: ferredoxin [Protofrankia]AEH09368.1 protein of unknown function DUF1271 [Candidatus Protofrankia datiscae]
MSRTVRISTHRDRCIGAGLCVLTAPEVFEHDDEEGLVSLLDPEPGVELSAKVWEAQQLCPARAIELAD